MVAMLAAACQNCLCHFRLGSRQKPGTQRRPHDCGKIDRKACIFAMAERSENAIDEYRPCIQKAGLFAIPLLKNALESPKRSK